MSSDEDSRERKPRRSRDRDEEDARTKRDDHEHQRRRRSRDPEEYGRKARERPSSSEPRRRERRRSRTPEPSRRRRSRSRDRDRDSEGNRERRRDRDRDRDADRVRKGRDRSADGKELAPRRRRRREDDQDSPPSSRRRSPVRRSGPLPSQADSFAVSKDGDGNGDEPIKPKEKPNFKASGLLAAASNSVQQADGTAIVLKYHEPPEARKPPAKDDWKLFVFKGEEAVDTIPLSLRSCWLVGREMSIVDLAAEHPSISKQHAAIQFRHVEKRNEYGDRIGKVKPYLIDLESANGTIMNGKKVQESRYVELRDKDVVKFGHSTREYVLMLAPK